MAKTKKQKQEIVKELSDKIKSAKSLIIFKHEGLSVVDSQALREKFQAENVEMLAAKKTLLTMALAEQGIKDIDVKSMEGGLAVAISPEDEVAAAKVIKTFAKEHEAVEFRSGLLEGNVLNLEEINKLADMPSKIELLAKMVGSMKAPISGFVNVMKGNLRGLVQVLNAIKDNK
jgi:large subunit ribosomal protein L10